jgi:hypothetical protein
LGKRAEGNSYSYKREASGYEGRKAEAFVLHRFTGLIC